MDKEQLRMQMLAGVITESEYKAKLEENLWDSIKNAPKSWLAKIKGGAPAILVKALQDSGFKVGKPIYYNEAGFLHKLELKSVDYNTGAVDITYEKSNDGGKSWEIDNAEGLYKKLDLEQELSILQNMDEKELQNWYNKTVEGTKKQFQNKQIAYNPKDLAEPASLNEHYVAGGIVGIGAINQIPSRAKADYEDAFEHFLSQKYDLKENEDDMPEAPSHKETDASQVYEEKINENYNPNRMLELIEMYVDNYSDEGMSAEAAIKKIDQLLQGNLDGYDEAFMAGKEDQY
jgi:hypothetical protein